MGRVSTWGVFAVAPFSIVICAVTIPPNIEHNEYYTTQWQSERLLGLLQKWTVTQRVSPPNFEHYIDTSLAVHDSITVFYTFNRS